jgi:nucleotide-binding universal stress UspA family protein
LDGSPFAEEALAPTIALAASLAAGVPCCIRLLQVVDIPRLHVDAGTLAAIALPNTPTQQTVWEDAHAYLDGVAMRVRALVPPTSAVTVSALVLYDIDAAQAILAAAEGKPDPQGNTPPPPCDFVVMTTHGRGGLALWALGSITERVLSHTTRPLFVVRPATLALQQATLNDEERQAATRQPAV